ncbi:hypothetical protein PY793_11840 [Acetobacter fabarum]
MLEQQVDAGNRLASLAVVWHAKGALPGGCCNDFFKIEDRV